MDTELLVNVLDVCLHRADCDEHLVCDRDHRQHRNRFAQLGEITHGRSSQAYNNETWIMELSRRGSVVL